MVHFTFPTPKGDCTIKVDCLPLPNGDKGVLYDCFITAINQWQQQGMSEEDFIKDMKEVISLVIDGNSDKTVMEILLKKHINDHGRLIDTDLCTYISELYMAFVAIKGDCDRNYFLNQMFQIAIQEFGHKLFFTKYRRTATGIKPYLIPYSELSY